MQKTNHDKPRDNQAQAKPIAAGLSSLRLRQGGRRILQSRPPGEYFGRYWNDQIVKGMAALDGIAEERVLSVAFEELIGNPKRWLSDIAEFFELERESDGWIEKGAALVRGVVPTRADELSRDEYERLIDACAPGSRLLGR